MMPQPPYTLRIAHLYPDELNIYGDRGNVLALYRRCTWRGLGCEVTPIRLGEAVHPEAFDLYFMGGGQDTQQVAVSQDLTRVKAQSLKYASEAGAVFLGICGGYQLLGHYYQPHEGPQLPGLGLMNHYTVAGETRFIGNVVIQRDATNATTGETLVGFENHSGKTYLGDGVSPLGRVLSGHGNNGEDQTEGAVFKTLYGSYLHGALLPKNPSLTDELITLGLKHRYAKQFESLALLPHERETKAHQAVLNRLGLPVGV
jgi:lipid II isoglutaminyl synthase (glutamine-hydrolysing)